MTLRSLSTIFALAMTTTLLACTDKGDGEETGQEETDLPGVEVCDNSADDDDDGDVDCDDSDCTDDAACQVAEDEDCDDAVDNDGDADIDCDDTDCAADPACAAPSTELDCDNATDDDADGAIDCADSDCDGDPACVSPDVEVACVDGVDNDADGLVDCADTDCVADPSCESPGVEVACVDEADNDLDGLVDCADPDCYADPDCTAVEVEVACVDGVDNDTDGLTDCDDSDCMASPDCLVPSTETICADGLDDDLDGALDCDDSDCDASPDCEEAASCGSDGDLGSALGYALASGTTTGGGDEFIPGCGSASAGMEDLSYMWMAPEDGTFTVNTVGSSFDTILTVLTSDCSSELACDDDGGGFATSTETFDAVAGEMFVFVVDGYSTSGDYVLSVYPSYESACRDGLDDDIDGAIDCADAECAGDATCIPEPVCDDGGDDDLDGAIDCDDTDCADLLVCTNPCVDDELGSPMGAAIVTGTTVGQGDDYTSECATYATEDVAWLWTAPADAVYTFDTVGSVYDTVLAIEQGDCSDSELGCDNDTTGTASEVSVALLAGEEVAVQIDGYDGSGEYVLNVWADAEVDCTDGGDDDLDGAIDCADVDCTGSSACVPEAVCADATDDDIDGNQDCLDSDCADDAACDTSLADFDLGSLTGVVVATGTTIAMGNEWGVSCTSSTAPDVSYSWMAPTSGFWNFDLGGSSYDTVLTVWSEAAVAIECDDDDGDGTTSLITRYVNAGDVMIIAVDGYSSYSGLYTLGIY
ncbi:MAG: hypothetical protein V4850_26120 [Myxococcota bacterium]